MYPIHIMSHNTGLIAEKITLEIIMGGVCTANITLSINTFDLNFYVHVALTLYKFTCIRIKRDKTLCAPMVHNLPLSPIS